MKEERTNLVLGKRETRQADDGEEVGVAAGEDWGEAVEAVPGNGRRGGGVTSLSCQEHV